MADLSLVKEIAAGDHHLAVLSIARDDGSVQASVVNAGVIADPVDGTPSVGLVAMGNSAKLKLLRRQGQATVVFRSGFQWVAVSGSVRLIGPDDGAEHGLDVPELTRSVFRAAGGDHEDWDEFDRVMALDRRGAVFVHAERVTSNPGT
jgi:hypothetical protein